MHSITKEQIHSLQLIISKAIHPHTDFASVFNTLKMLESLPQIEEVTKDEE